MTIFRKVMGKDFSLLHPMLQKRYDLPSGTVFKATGIMSEIKVVPNGSIPFLESAQNGSYSFPNVENRSRFQLRILPI